MKYKPLSAGNAELCFIGKGESSVLEPQTDCKYLHCFAVLLDNKYGDIGIELQKYFFLMAKNILIAAVLVLNAIGFDHFFTDFTASAGTDVNHNIVEPAIGSNLFGAFVLYFELYPAAFFVDS